METDYYNGLLSTNFSFGFGKYKNIGLFKKNLNNNIIPSLKGVFSEINGKPYDLVNIEYFKESFINRFKDRIIGDTSAIKFPYINCKLLNFNDSFEDTNTFQEVSLSQPYSYSNLNKEEIYNELILIKKGAVPNINSSEELFELEAALYDISLLLGLRRIELFTSTFASRFFNIILPWGKIQVSEKINKSDYKKDYFIVPVISLLIKSIPYVFRRNISVSLIIIPVEKTEGVNVRSKICPEDIAAIIKAFRSWDFKITFENCPLKDVLEKSPQDIDTELEKENRMLPLLLMENLYKIFAGGSNGKKVDEGYFNNQYMVSRQWYSSLMPSFSLKNDLITDFFLENRLEKKWVTEEIKLFLLKIVDPVYRTGNKVYPNTLDLSKLNVNDENRLDTSYLIFYNPSYYYLSVLQDGSAEEFPGYSIKFLFSMQFYMSLGISSVSSIIYNFYEEFEGGDEAKALKTVQKELIKDLDEYYNLFMFYYFYKSIYEKVKNLAGIGQQYKKLRDKMGTTIDDISLNRQHRTNFILTVLTIVLVVTAIIQIIIIIIHK